MSDLISRSALLAEYDRQHEGEAGRARKLMEEAPAVNAVVLPCKIGEKVFYMFQYSNQRFLPFVRTAKVRKIYCANKKMEFLVDVELTDTKEKGIIKTFYASDFGKTVFGTKVEAEKALGERKENV